MQPMYETIKDICPNCHAQPMTANCNNANCIPTEHDFSESKNNDECACGAKNEQEPQDQDQEVDYDW